MKNLEKPWYKKKGYVVSLVILGLIFVSGLDNSDNRIKSDSTTVPSYAPTYQTANSITGLDLQDSQKTSRNTRLSNDNYYTNVNGNTVHSPAYSTDNSVPAGASAGCRDGTYSFSQNRRGTCSHHGGVRTWY